MWHYLLIAPSYSLTAIKLQGLYWGKYDIFLKFGCVSRKKWIHSNFQNTLSFDQKKIEIPFFDMISEIPWIKLLQIFSFIWHVCEISISALVHEPTKLIVKVLRRRTIPNTTKNPAIADRVTIHQTKHRTSSTQRMDDFRVWNNKQNHGVKSEGNLETWIKIGDGKGLEETRKDNAILWAAMRTMTKNSNRNAWICSI